MEAGAAVRREAGFNDPPGTVLAAHVPFDGSLSRSAPASVVGVDENQDPVRASGLGEVRRCYAVTSHHCHPGCCATLARENDVLGIVSA